MPARSTALSASLAWSCGTLRAASAKWPVQLKTTVPWVLHPKCQVDDLWCSPTLFGAGGQDARRHAADVLGRQPLAMVAFRHLTRAGAAPNADYERQATRCEVLRTDHSALDQRPGFYVGGGRVSPAPDFAPTMYQQARRWAFRRLSRFRRPGVAPASLPD